MRQCVGRTRLPASTRRWIDGSTNAAVLPVPVCAMPSRSRPSSTVGIACAWIGVGVGIALGLERADERLGEAEMGEFGHGNLSNSASRTPKGRTGGGGNDTPRDLGSLSLKRPRRSLNPNGSITLHRRLDARAYACCSAKSQGSSGGERSIARRPEKCRRPCPARASRGASDVRCAPARIDPASVSPRTSPTPGRVTKTVMLSVSPAEACGRATGVTVKVPPLRDRIVARAAIARRLRNRSRSARSWPGPGAATASGDEQAAAARIGLCIGDGSFSGDDGERRISLYAIREAGQTRPPAMEAALTKNAIARSVSLAQVPYVFLRYPGFAVALDA